VEICTVGSVRGESVGAAMVDLNGHEAGNGRHSQGRPTARRVLLYSERCPVIRLIRSWADGLDNPCRSKTNETLTYFRFEYSAFAAMRMGMSGSASFQSVRKS
jgi:hypothetical protein